jgi:hypothetical protein
LTSLGAQNKSALVNRRSFLKRIFGAGAIVAAAPLLTPNEPLAIARKDHWNDKWSKPELKRRSWYKPWSAYRPIHSADQQLAAAIHKKMSQRSPWIDFK